MLVQKWSWVGAGAPKGARKELKRRIEEELHRFERFQLAEEEFRTAPVLMKTDVMPEDFSSRWCEAKPSEHSGVLARGYGRFVKYDLPIRGQRSQAALIECSHCRTHTVMD